MRVTGTAFCTIASANHASRIRTLAASLANSYPDAVLHALVMDRPDAELGDGVEGNIRWVSPRALTIEPGLFAEMASMYSPLELSCALKPFLARDLLGAGASRVIYLDSDTWVLQPFDDFIAEAESTGLVLTPHVRHALAPARDRTDVEGITLKAGLINMGVFGVSAEGLPFLDWLAKRLERESLHDPESHRNADQRWVDLALTIFPHSLSSDEGVNVGWWSFAGSDLTTDAGGSLMIGGTAVKVLHMSGFDPARPWLLSTHAGIRPHTLLSEYPALADACRIYASELALRRCGDDEQPYGFGALPDGLRMDDRVRRIYRMAVWHADRGSEPYPPAPLLDPEGFRRWLEEPTGALGSPAPLSRYLRDVYNTVPGASAQFPDIDATDAERFLGWSAGEGVADHGVQPALASGGAERPERPHPFGSDGDHILIVGESDRPAVRQDDALPDALSDALTSVGTSGVIAEGGRDGAPTNSARACLRENDRAFFGSLLAAPPSALPMLNHAFGGRILGDIPTWPFLLWHYDVADDGLVADLRLIHNFIVPSTFSAGALADAGAVSPTVVGLPVSPATLSPREAPVQGGDFHLYAPVDLDDGGFRSQAEVLIEAVREARSHGVAVSLLLGLRGADRWPVEAERWRVAAACMDGIVTTDIGVSAPSGDPNLLDADAVFSVHRTEGFAWTAAAAMASGVPVAATAFGGNLDYMDESNAWLIEPASIGSVDSGGSAPEGCRVAEVATLTVAETIVALVEDRDRREARAREGLDVGSRFSPSAVGVRLVRMFERVRGRQDRTSRDPSRRIWRRAH